MDMKRKYNCVHIMTMSGRNVTITHVIKIPWEVTVGYLTGINRNINDRTDNILKTNILQKVFYVSFCKIYISFASY